jgi:uncharacterized membrane protein
MRGMAFFELDERGRALDRVLAFSDGVFAIAITLLVLAFRVPVLHGLNENRRLLDSLLSEGDLLVGFAVSFFVIARFWMTHHRLSVLLRHVDSRFIALNLAFLAFVVFLPFPAEIIGLYGGTTTAAVFYAGTLMVTSAMSATLWTYAFSNRLVDDHSPRVLVRQAWIRSGFLIAVFGLSIPVAFLDPGNAELVWLLLLTQAVIPSRFWGETPSSASTRSAAPRPSERPTRKES